MVPLLWVEYGDVTTSFCIENVELYMNITLEVLMMLINISLQNTMACDALLSNSNNADIHFALTL